MYQVYYIASQDKLKGLALQVLTKGRDRPYTHCNKPSHHRSLCPKLFDPQSDAPPDQNVSNVIDGKEMMLTSGSQVQMQTATSMVKNLSSSSLALVHVILDSIVYIRLGPYVSSVNV